MARAFAMSPRSIARSSKALPTCTPVTVISCRSGSRKRIVREHERLCVVTRQLKQLEAKSKAELRAARPGSPEARIMQIIDLKSIGPVGGQKSVNEVFYRDFDNRRQVGSYFGLTGTPYNSGDRSREQGISKAGNWRARELAVELAWLWTVHQPDSALASPSR